MEQQQSLMWDVKSEQEQLKVTFASCTFKNPFLIHWFAAEATGGSTFSAPAGCFYIFCCWAQTILKEVLVPLYSSPNFPLQPAWANAARCHSGSAVLGIDSVSVAPQEDLYHRLHTQ